MFQKHTCRFTRENTYQNKIASCFIKLTSKTPDKIHGKRTCHSSQLEKDVKTRTKSSFRIVPSSLSYRFLDNYRTKLPSQKLCKAEICKKLEKLHIKQVTDERAQNATPVEETPCNHSKRDPCTLRRRSKCDPCRGNAV